MTINALLFDVDGTLADTEDAHLQAFNATFEAARLGWHWEKAEYRELLSITGGKERINAYLDTLAITTPERRRLRELIPGLHAEKTRLYGEVVRAGGVPLRDGVERLFEEARSAGCHLGIATTTTGANVDALLSATLGPRSVDWFSVMVCGDAVRAKKPAPDIYKLALQTLGLQPEEAVAFEDSTNGLRSAKGAGLFTVITPNFWTEGSDFSSADLVLPRLGDPSMPLSGEPGGRLRRHAWLTLDELTEKCRPAPCTVAALYE